MDYEPGILSALRPVFTPGTGETAISIVVENFGLVTSKPENLKLQVVSPEGLQEIAAGAIAPIQSYGKLTLQLSTAYPFEKGKEYEFLIAISDAGPSTPTFGYKATPLP